MAKIMQYTDSFADTYPASYWRPETCVITKVAAEIEFFGYPDASRKGKRVIGPPKRFFVTGDDFTKFFSAAALSPQGVNPISQAYAYADTTADFVGATDA